MVLGTSRYYRVPLPFFKASAVRVADASSKDSCPQPLFKIRYLLPFQSLFSGSLICLGVLVDNIRDYVKGTDFSTS